MSDVVLAHHIEQESPELVSCEIHCIELQLRTANQQIARGIPESAR